MLISACAKLSREDCQLAWSSCKNWWFYAQSQEKAHASAPSLDVFFKLRVHSPFELPCADCTSNCGIRVFCVSICFYDRLTGFLSCPFHACEMNA